MDDLYALLSIGGMVVYGYFQVDVCQVAFVGYKGVDEEMCWLPMPYFSANGDFFHVGVGAFGKVFFYGKGEGLMAPVIFQADGTEVYFIEVGSVGGSVQQGDGVGLQMQADEFKGMGDGGIDYHRHLSGCTEPWAEPQGVGIDFQDGKVREQGSNVVFGEVPFSFGGVVVEGMEVDGDAGGDFFVFLGFYIGNFDLEVCSIGLVDAGEVVYFDFGMGSRDAVGARSGD